MSPRTKIKVYKLECDAKDLIIFVRDAHPFLSGALSRVTELDVRRTAYVTRVGRSRPTPALAACHVWLSSVSLADVLEQVEVDKERPFARTNVGMRYEAQSTKESIIIICLKLAMKITSSLE